MIITQFGVIIKTCRQIPPFWTCVYIKKVIWKKYKQGQSHDAMYLLVMAVYISCCVVFWGHSYYKNAFSVLFYPFFIPGNYWAKIKIQALKSRINRLSHTWVKCNTFNVACSPIWLKTWWLDNIFAWKAPH